ncbi:MAG: hypothetical protein ACRCWB_03775 [Enterovibrio sp.]
MSMKKFLRHCSTSAVNLAEAFAHVSQAINEAATALDEATTRYCANSRASTKTANTVNNTAAHSTNWANETMELAVYEARLHRVTLMVKGPYANNLPAAERASYLNTCILSPAMKQEATAKIAETMQQPPSAEDKL